MEEKDAFKINISLLQTFHLVAKHGSFSAASRALSISYQSAANHVRRLEQLYGSKLIETDRGSRQVTLSPKGKALYASLSGELDNILSRIALLLHNERSMLRIGVPQALFHHFFPSILRDFKQQASSMELAFYERDTTLEKMMLEGLLDAAVSERFFGQDAITQHALGEYKLCLIYPRLWFPSSEPLPTITQFAEREMITYEPGQTIRVRSTESLAHHFGKVPKISLTTSGSTSIVQLVGVGLGYSIVPQWLVSAGDPHIAQIVMDDIPPVSVYFAHTTLLSSNAFVHQLHETCGRIMGGQLSAASKLTTR
jgi:molybdate transport repressor ModE-like protein